jgi:ABC-type glycerol-3-phosphate transport system permease component
MKGLRRKKTRRESLSVESGRKERVLLYLFLGTAALAFLVPMYWLLTSAFKTQAEIFSAAPGLFPWPPRVENLTAVFGQTNLPRAFFNTTLIAVFSVGLTLFLCSLAGMAFARYPDAPGHRWLFAFVLGTMLIPGAVTMIPVFVVLTNLNMVNTYWAMILPGAASAFGIFWMRQYIASNVPRDLYDAAAIDGAGEFATYWRVVLPIARPALGALGVLTLIASWNNLMWAFIVLRTENMATMPLLIYLLQGEQRTPYGLIMAAGLVATIPLVIAFLFFQRAFISGITAGAVKS